MRSLWRLGPWPWLVISTSSACQSPASPGADSAPSVASPAAPVVSPSAALAAVPSANAGPPASASAAASALPIAAVASAAPVAPPAELGQEPPLHDAEGKPLPQTDERPRVDSPAFKRRIELLAQAIIEDSPTAARPVFFPLVAYEQVKAIEKPARDWERRLMRAFERNVHEYHQKLGPEPARAKFLGISVNEAAARFMKPGSEGNRVGYHRVLRSRLAFERSDGKRLELELTSMISWRGEWYVVHLHGFE